MSGGGRHGQGGWVGLKICALDTLGETGAWGSAHRYALVSHILWPAGFPLAEPDGKTIPLRSRVSLEAERIQGISASSIPLISERTSTGVGPTEVLGAQPPARPLLRLSAAPLWGWQRAGAQCALDEGVNEPIGQSGRCLRPEIPGLASGVWQEVTDWWCSELPTLALRLVEAGAGSTSWRGTRMVRGHSFYGLRNHSRFGVFFFFFLVIFTPSSTPWTYEMDNITNVLGGL